MRNLRSLRVRNLRSFGGDNDYVPLRKVNLFVGRNSCGKSTFLRTFPLLRQSVEASTRSPILWYGDYVDFGDLNTAKNSAADEVFFDFKMNLPIKVNFDFIERAYFWGATFVDFTAPSQERNINFPVSLTLGMSLTDKREILSRVLIDVSGVGFEIAYKGGKVEYLEIKSEASAILIRREQSRILAQGKLIPLEIGKVDESTKDAKSLFDLSYRHDFLSEFASFMQKYHHGNKSVERLKSELSELALCGKDNVLDGLRKIFKGNKYFESSIESHSSEISEGAFLYLVSMNISRFLRAADQALHGFYSGVRYLGPVRASAERFYRHQDLQVAEVDHTGANLPMVLNSLTNTERGRLNSWMAENFGFELKLINSGLHYAISIKESGGLDYNNVSDMGFGYSQILPVIVSVWLENERINGRGRPQVDARQIVIAIEQPELHLHPELQHRFGVAISGIAKACASDRLCFVIETHSKHIIDALGECIEEGIIGNDDVGINLFEKNCSGETKTSLSGYDENGYLISWPAGFLSP